LIEEPRQRNLLLFSLPVIVALFYVTASLHFSYTPDDTYIYLQFARNIAAGNGVSFNAGEPTYGVTGPLWMFIVALGAKMGVDPYIGAKAIDLVLASLVLIAFYFLAYEILRDVGVSLCATVAFSVNAWFLRWAGSGMETSLSVLLVLATVLFCLRNEYLLSVVCAGLLTLTRPEGVLMTVLIMTDLYFNSLQKRRALAMGAWLLLVYSVVVAPWTLYAFRTFGTPLPNTAVGKVGWDFTIADTVSTLRDVLQTLAAADGTALLVFLTGGVLLLILYRHPPADAPGKERRRFLGRQSIVGVGWISGLVVFYVASGTNVVSRYLLLITPLITIYAFSFLVELLSVSRWRQRANLAVIVLTAVVMLQNQLLYRRYVLPGVDAFEQGMEACLIPIGQWLREHTPPASTVVTGDIGALGFFSERRMCDAAGLVSPSLLPLLHRGVPPYDIIKQELYRSCCSPDYVVDRDFSPERLGKDPALVALLTRPFPNMTLSDPRIVYYTVYRVRPAAGRDTLPGREQ
jgi:arabinofuranosyltransferase